MEVLIFIHTVWAHDPQGREIWRIAGIKNEVHTVVVQELESLQQLTQYPILLNYSPLDKLRGLVKWLFPKSRKPMQLYKLLQTQEYRQVDRSRMKTIASPVSEVQGLVDKSFFFWMLSQLSLYPLNISLKLLLQHFKFKTGIWKTTCMNMQLVFSYNCMCMTWQ